MASKTATAPATAHSQTDPRLRLFDEGIVDIDKAYLAVTGETICPTTGLRWGLHGKRGVRLETIKVSRGRRVTSVAAMRRFISATQPQAPLPREVAMDVAAADKVLAAFGLPRGRK